MSARTQWGTLGQFSLAASGNFSGGGIVGRCGFFGLASLGWAACSSPSSSCSPSSPSVSSLASLSALSAFAGLTGSPSSLSSASPFAAGSLVLASASSSALERSEEHTSELQSLMRISYAVFCLKKKNNTIVSILKQIPYY